LNLIKNSLTTWLLSYNTINLHPKRNPYFGMNFAIAQSTKSYKQMTTTTNDVNRMREHNRKFMDSAQPYIERTQQATKEFTEMKKHSGDVLKIQITK
jgi:hypothetical protein